MAKTRDINKMTDADLQAELTRRQNERKSQQARQEVNVKMGGWAASPVGTWKVTTEGDVEGRSTTNLGIYTGHVVDIAAQLATRCFYSLQFEPIDPLPPKPVSDSFKVNISLNIDSGTWNLTPGDRRNVLDTWLNLAKPKLVDKFVVKEGQYYASVKVEGTVKQG